MASPSPMPSDFSVVGRHGARAGHCPKVSRSEEHTSELQSHLNLVCRLLLEKKKKQYIRDLQDDRRTVRVSHRIYELVLDICQSPIPLYYTVQRLVYRSSTQRAAYSTPLPRL